jgi:CDP-diacylglycerol--glycerol-3-phosphate 3-phosphatidyltransferase/cardiolipin synthase
MIPLIVGIFYFPEHWLTLTQKNWTATLIFAGAAVTDWLDGYLARTLNQTSSFGAFLDPVADKLTVAASLILLVQIGRVDALVALVIIGREIAISALREWMAKIGQSKNVAVSFLGKIKTISQMAAILLLLLHEEIYPGIDCALIGTICIYIAAILTLWSMVYYFRAALPYVLNENETLSLFAKSKKRLKKKSK